MKKVIAVVQARTSSSRLPGKVLLPLSGMPMIVYQMLRLRKSKLLDDVLLATSTHASDDVLCQTVEKSGFNAYRGSLDDVLGRYTSCSKNYNADVVVRITGDCPLIDAEIVDEALTAFFELDVDYLANGSIHEHISVPDGYDIEIFNSSLLESANNNAVLQSDREHVTPWMRSASANANIALYQHKPKRPYFRLSVDYLADFKLVNAVVEAVSITDPEVRIDSVIQFLLSNPSIAASNMATIRNEGYLKSIDDDKDQSQSIKLTSSGAGQNLWTKAKKIIPGGNMLLSKRAEMFLPNLWPSYFSRAKGCNVWDLDGNKYTDMSIMGIGTNLLGYGHSEIDSSVADVVASGNMSTFNCPEEVYLAERLIDLHPWAGGVRFARSGGEANAISIRIARAATGKDGIAICGYHGWHDWYLSTNLNNKTGLDNHLLPGLSPRGVPKSLTNTVHPFNFNDIDALRTIIAQNDIAAVKMEVQRSSSPSPGFLQEVRELCTNNGIVLIFDECTSGFRETFGGLHKKYNISPDLAVFGKAMGNGYAITAVIGRDSIMDYAQDTFISSTFWTERIGPTAALKTLDVMSDIESWKIITEKGTELQNLWLNLAKDYFLNLEVSGIPAISAFTIKSESVPFIKYKTLITQEMLKRGFLASNLCYLSIAHTDTILDEYREQLQYVFALIGKCEQNPALIDDLLETSACHSGFKRLN